MIVVPFTMQCTANVPTRVGTSSDGGLWQICAACGAHSALNSFSAFGGAYSKVCLDPVSIHV